MPFLNFLYNAVQALPDPVLNVLASVMPYSADNYAPRGFFTPAPTLPPAVMAPKGLVPQTGLVGSNLILQPYCCVTGKVIYVEQSPPVVGGVPAWDHETFGLVPDKLAYLNAYNDQIIPGPTTSAVALPSHHLWLEVEPELGAKLPIAGQYVKVFGAISIQLAWGYVEFRPCYSWQLVM